MVALPDKPLVWLHGEIKTPPFSSEARIEVGCLLRRLRRGGHELRIVDGERTWRIIYRVNPDAIVIAEVFAKKTRKSPASVIARCQHRLRGYDDAVRPRRKQ